MTQSRNLGAFADNLNISGQASLTTGSDGKKYYWEYKTGAWVEIPLTPSA
jgi:hypothetical protein